MAASPRDLDVVIGDLLGTVPETETALRSKLLAIRESVAFTAPEGMALRWSQRPSPTHSIDRKDNSMLIRLIPNE